MAKKQTNQQDIETPNTDVQEQMLHRQSAPRPSALGELERLTGNAAGAIDGFRALEEPIGKEAVQKATQIFQRYKEGKANLELRVKKDEEWYRLRHWQYIEHGEGQIEPVSAWLFNSLANKHAEAMDNYPAANVLPREEGDKEQAKMLTSILPVIMDQTDFEATYDEVWDEKLKNGTGIYGVYWDPSEMHGLGNISIKPVDILTIFWEPGVTDIQRSRNVFTVELQDNDMLVSKYPQLMGKLGTKTIDTNEYVYDDRVDTTDKSAVIDWYYKKVNSQGKQVLHYVKFVNDTVLYATENMPELAELGLYNHGKYPFLFDRLFKCKGTPAGFGYVDLGKSCQEYIDRGDQALLENMLFNARPRFFVREDGEVNAEKFSDPSEGLIPVSGNMGQDSIMPVPTSRFDGNYIQMHEAKIDELKETTGNRDVNTGGTTSGVTAAAAIAAMQEAGSRLSRDANKASYRVFRNLCLMVIELIRQFYDLPRCFRIMGERGAEEFIQFSNAGILPQAQGSEFGIDMGSRIPLFDLQITAEKQSPYSKMSQNELALQFFNSGFFNPQIADQALLCLDMMDFDRKDAVMQKIVQNGMMFNQIVALQQQMLQLGGMVDASRGTNEVSAALAQQFGMNPQNSEALGGKQGESSVTSKARERVADSTSPR